MSSPAPCFQVFQEYMDSVQQAQARVKGRMKRCTRQLAESWMEPETRGLMALREVSELTALTTLAELRDLTRFGSPRQVMAFVGLVPSEHSSGNRRQRGAITEAGNAHVRRVLAGAAWCYRFPGRKTAHLQRRAPTSLACPARNCWIRSRVLDWPSVRVTARRSL